MKTRPERVRAYRAVAQHLSDATPAPSLVVAAAAACGVTETTPGAAALSLAARVPDLEPANLAPAYGDEHSLVTVWSRRGLPCVVPAGDLAVFTLGLCPADESAWREMFPALAPMSDTAGVSIAEMVELARQAAIAALEAGPLPRRELVAAVAAALPPAITKWFDERATASAAGLLVRGAALGGACVLTPRDDGDVDCVRTDHWLGEFPDIDSDALASARRELARRFVHAYGPASAKGFAEWAGMGENAARNCLADIDAECTAVSVEGAHGVMLAGDAAMLETAPEPLGVRFLPAGDPYLASPDRRVIVPEATLQKRLWRGSGTPGAVWAGGEIAGAWRVHGSGSRVTFDVETFRTLPVAMMRSLELAAPRAAAFLGASVVKVIWR